MAATETPVSSASELAAAINGASGELVIKLTADITEAVAATVPEGAEITINGNGKTLSGGMQIGSDISTHQDKGSLTVQNATFTGSGLYIFLVSNVVVEKNTFKDITGRMALQVNYQKDTTDKVVVKDNLIDGVTGGEVAGMELRGVQTVEITGNTIKNVGGTCILLTCNVSNPANSAPVTVTGNILENWGTSHAGRAFRADFNNQTGKLVKFESNDMIHTNAPEQFAKVSNLGTDTTVSVDDNYWNGKTDLTGMVDGVAAPAAGEIKTAPVNYVAPAYAGPVMNWVKVNAADNGVVKSGPLAASEGATITLYPKAATGYVLDTVEVLDAEGNAVQLDGMKFKVPAGGVTVNATFKLAE